MERLNAGIGVGSGKVSLPRSHLQKIRGVYTFFLRGTAKNERVLPEGMSETI